MRLKHVIHHEEHEGHEGSDTYYLTPAIPAIYKYTWNPDSAVLHPGYRLAFFLPNRKFHLTMKSAKSTKLKDRKIIFF